MFVRDVMVGDLVTVDADATLRAAVERMVTARVGSTVVTREGSPAGLITETDALRAGYETDRPFSEIPASDLIDGSLVTVEPDATLRSATATMKEEGVKKLLVVEDLSVVGIVTLTDVVWQFPAIWREAVEIGTRRWEEED